MTAIKDINPAEFEVSYGGVSLGPLVRYTLTVVPEYDRARRTAIYDKYVLRTTSFHYATDEEDMSATMSNIRQTLRQSGRKLVIEAIGIGDTDSRGNAPDIVWGPHPLEATYKPLGGGVCWQLDWACEFKINPCADSRAKVGGTKSKPLVMFNYETAYNHDGLGFTTRVVTATLQIPQDGSTYTVADVPEYYRHKVFIPTPTNYRRIAGNERVNAAQNELVITAVDEQLRTEPFPAGIAFANVRFSVSSRNALTNANYAFSVSGALETVPGFPKSHAQIKFFQIAFTRLMQLRNVTGRAAILPLGLNMDHEPFGRTSSFRMTFLVQGDKGGQSIFHPAVLYSKLPDSDYRAWTTTIGPGGKSLANLWEQGGQTNLRTQPVPIVDLCNRTESVTLNYAAGTFPLGAPEHLSPYDYFGCPEIAPEHSWLAYEPVIQLYRIDRISVNKRDVYMQFPDGNGQGPQGSFRSTKNYGVGSKYPTAGDTISRSGAPEQRVIFKGKAIRIKHELAIPRLQSVEGVNLTYLQSAEDVTQGPAIFGCPTNYGRWFQIYRPDGYLAKVPPMPHANIEYQGEIRPPRVQ